MISRNARSVQLGDRFVKNGDPYGRIWVVIRVWTTIDGLLHARMENNDRQHETRIISVSALVDDHFFTSAPVIAGGE
jgi:hypothetical protein